MVWKFKLSEDVEWKTGQKLPITKTLDFRDLKGKLRLQITPAGKVRVKKNYAWDGCTPKISVFDLFYFGTPDGVIDIETGQPKTYYASLVHDALYQFLDDDQMPFNRADADRFFLILMGETGFKLRLVYYVVVRSFGGVFRLVNNFLDRWFNIRLLNLGFAKV